MGKAFEVLSKAMPGFLKAGNSNPAKTQFQSDHPGESVTEQLPGARSNIMSSAHTPPAAEPTQQPAISSSQAKWLRDLNTIASHLVALSAQEQLAHPLFVFTSVEHHAGTSSISYHTARLLALSKPEQSVLCISFSAARRRTETNDLSDLLEGKHPISDILAEHSKPGVNYLTFPLLDQHVQAPVAPQRLLEFFEESRKQYSWIIIDAPPFSSGPAMFSLARATDGVVIVARAGVTRVPAINALSAELEEYGVRPVGAILNHRVYPIPKPLLRLF
jgi:Mrp family chromosome partitioning ATPase